jgi:hypothetical protein
MTIGDLMTLFADGIARGLYSADTPVEVECWGSEGESDALEHNAWTIDGRVILKTAAAFSEEGLIDTHHPDEARAFWAIVGAAQAAEPEP